uniref:Uncharacterized protein n=6 Tax=Simiiformes TaxID=314293 RepID=A0A2K5LI45_CERAT
MAWWKAWDSGILPLRNALLLG